MLEVSESIGYSFDRLDGIVDAFHDAITEASSKERGRPAIQDIIFPGKEGLQKYIQCWMR